MPRSCAQRRSSAGFALIALLALVTAGVLFFLLESLSPDAIDARRQRQNEDILAQAREALIGYALKYRDVEGPTTVYGYLPLPDLGTSRNNNVSCTAEGCDAANFAGNAANVTVVGRFPWRTLGTGPLRDSYGECLWLAVSGSHQRVHQASPMNWDTLGHLDVVAANGTGALASIVATPHERPIAVVFSAGPPLPGQSRTASASDDVAQCGGNYDARNYLDPGTAGALAAVTNYFTGSTNNASGDTGAGPKSLSPQGVVQKASDGKLWSRSCPSGVACTQVANDSGLLLTTDSLFDALRKSSNFRIDINSMLDRMVSCLRDRIAAPGGFALAPGRIPPDACYDDNQVPQQYFSHWRELVFAGTGGFTVNGTACPGVVAFAGQRSSSQSRATVAERNDFSNYLEGANLAGINGGGTLFTGDSIFNTTGSGQSRQQDIVRCVPGTPSLAAVESPALTNLGFGQLVEYNPATRILTLGRAGVTTGASAPAGALFGCAWTPEANSQGQGFRAYFTFRFRQIGTSVGDNGFTFAAVDTESNAVPGCGAAGSQLGYSGNNGVTPSLTFPKIGIEFDQGRQAGFSETGVTAGRNDPCGTSGCGGSVGYNSHAAIVYWGHASANATDGVTLPADDDNVHGFPGAGSQGTNPRPSPRNPDMAPGIAFVNLRGQATEGGDSYLYHVRVEVTPSRDITGVVPELRKTGMRTEVWIERDSGTSAQLLAAMRNTTRPMNQLYPGYAARLADSAVVYDSVGATCGGGCPAGQECGSDNMCYRQSLKSVRLGFTGSQRTQDQQVDIGNFFASWLQ